MSHKSETISVRTARLNHILLGQVDAALKTNKTICEGLNREGLLDALCCMYDECNKDNLKRKDKNVAEFVNKCKWFFFVRLCEPIFNFLFFL